MTPGTTFGSIHHPIVWVSLAGSVLSVNTAFCHFVGYPASELRRKNIFELLAPATAEAEQHRLMELFQREASLPEEEWQFRRKDGHLVWGLVSGLQQSSSHSREPLWVLYLTDVTYYKKTEALLHATESKLREATQRLYAAQETERRSIASELHDNVGQKLASLVVELELLRGRPSSSRKGARFQRECEKLHQIINDVSEDIHDVANRLRPSVLEFLSLPDAVRALVKTICMRGRVRCTFSEQAVPQKISPDSALCLYRITQEALCNVVKHSRSPRIKVKLAGKRREVELTIQDFGVGFEAATRMPGKLGLLTMEERVNALGGEFLLKSRPGEGTTIRARIPRNPAPQLLTSRRPAAKSTGSPARGRSSAA
jgi:PAS domain S-box-containing protein